MPPLTDPAQAWNRSGGTPQQAVHGAARRYARLRSAALLAARLGDFAALALLLLLPPVIVDHALLNGAPLGLLRGYGLILVAALLVTAALQVWRVVRTRWHPLFLARELERGAGVPHNLLVNFESLERSGRYGYASTAAARAAADALRDAEQGGVDWRPRPGAFRCTAPIGAALAAWLLFAGASDKSVLHSLGRVVGFAWDAPHAVRIEWHEPGAERCVYAAEPLEMRFSCRGRWVGGARLELLENAGDAVPRLVHQLQPLGRQDGAEWFRIELSAHEVSRDLPFRCRAGDAELAGVVRVRHVPVLESLSVTIEPPAYCQSPPLRVAAERLPAVLRGSRLRIEAVGNVPMRDPIFAFRPMGGRIEQRTGLAPASDARTATLDLRAAESGEFWIEFADQAGRRANGARRQSLIVRADGPPNVRWELGELSLLDEPLNLNALAFLRVAASDDVGLSGLDLVIDRAGIVQRIVLPTPAGANVKQASADVATAELRVSEGELVQAWFEARDNFARADGRPAPQSARSAVLQLTRAAIQALATPPTSSPAVSPSADARTAVARRAAGGGGGSGGDNGDAARPAGEPQPDNGPPVGGNSVADAGGRGANGARSDRGEPTVVERADATAGDAQARQEFVEELRGFVETYGREIGQAAQATGGAAGEAGGGGGASGSPAESQPAGAAPWSTDSQSAASAPAPKRSSSDEQPEQPPEAGSGGASAPETQPARRVNAAAEEPKAKTGESRVDEAGQPPNSHPKQPAAPDGDSQPASDPGAAAPASQPESGPDTSTEMQAAGQPNSVGPDEKAPAGDSGRADDSQPASREEASGTESAAEPAEGAEKETGEQPPDESGEQAATVPLPGAAGLGVPSADLDPSGTDWSENLDSVGSARSEFVHALELLARVDAVREQDLVAGGWPAERARQFVRDLARLEALARRAALSGALRRWAAARMPGDAAANVPGPDAAARLDWLLGAAGASTAEGEAITPPADQQVEAELQAILNGYYRALSERGRDGAAQSRPSGP